MVEKFEIVIDNISRPLLAQLSSKYKIEVEYIKGHKITLVLYKKAYSFTEFTKIESLLIDFKDNLNYVNSKSPNSRINSSYYDENKLNENFPKYISSLVMLAELPLIVENEFNKFSLKAYRREKRLQKILKTNEN